MIVFSFRQIKIGQLWCKPQSMVAEALLLKTDLNHVGFQVPRVILGCSNEFQRLTGLYVDGVDATELNIRTSSISLVVTAFFNIESHSIMVN